MEDRDEKTFGVIILLCIIVFIIAQCGTSDKDYDKTINDAEYIYDRN